MFVIIKGVRLAATNYFLRVNSYLSIFRTKNGWKFELTNQNSQNINFMKNSKSSVIENN